MTEAAAGLTIPTSIEEATDKAWLQRALDGAGLGLRVDSAEWRDASNPGENFNSLLYAIKVRGVSRGAGPNKEGEQQELNLVAKIAPTNPQMRAISKEMNVFCREIVVYRDLMPEYARVLGDWRPPPDSGEGGELGAEAPLPAPPPNSSWMGMAPRLYHAAYDPESGAGVMLLQDARTPEGGGHRLEDRLGGLDDPALMRLVQRRLAYWHAAGAAYSRRGGDQDGGGEKQKLQQRFPQLVSPFATAPEQKPMFAQILAGIILQAGDTVQFVVADKPELKEKVARLYKRFMTDMGPLVRAESSRLPTVTHGDLWTCNMLTRRDPANGKPLDALFIDYQVSCCAGPAYDLCYLFNTSTTLPARRKYADQHLNYYYEQLSTALARWGVDISTDLGYTRQVLDEELNKMRPLALAASAMVVQSVCAKPMRLGEQTLEEYIVQRQQEITTHSNPELNQRIRDLILELDEQKLL